MCAILWWHISVKNPLFFSLVNVIHIFLNTASMYSQWSQRSRKLCCCIFFFKFPEVVSLVLTKSASCLGVHRVTDSAKFQVRITKDEAQTPLLFCSHDYCSRFRFSLPPPLYFYFLFIILKNHLILSLLVLWLSRYHFSNFIYQWRFGLLRCYISVTTG